MILRRLAQSLKEQNWTAITIEFVLLVAGVFLGIQVSNWNQERETARKAQVFTERLRDDLRVEVWRFRALQLYYADVNDNVRIALRDLEGLERASNEALLIAAYRATQYSEFVQYRATYDELTATGNIGLLKDRQLRRMATEVYATPLYANVKAEGINSEYRLAFRRLVPVHVQIAVGVACGDRPSDVLNYRSIEHPIGYPCKTGLPQADIDAAAQALRAAPGLPAMLRLRLMNMRSSVATQIMSQDVIDGLEALARQQQSTPKGTAP